MGVYSQSCCISGVPVGSSCHMVDSKNFDWVQNVRVVLKNGEVTEIGYYDDYGSVIVDDKEYKIIDKTLCDDEIEHDGFIIIDKVYQMLLNNEDYHTIKDENLYQLIKERGWKHGIGELVNHVHKQFVIITTNEMKDDFSSPVIVDSDEIYLFTDPDVSPKNYEDIDERITLFIYNYI